MFNKEKEDGNLANMTEQQQNLMNNAFDNDSIARAID